MSDLEKRVSDLETAIIALGSSELTEFGDLDGHPFRGNQYSDPIGGIASAVDKYRETKKFDPATARKPPPAPPAPPKPAKPLTDKQIEREVKAGVKHYEAGLEDVRRDMPEVPEEDAAHDIADSVQHFVHPEARREFLDRIGWHAIPVRR